MKRDKPRATRELRRTRGVGLCIMRREPQSIHVLNYGRPRPTFCIHRPTAIVTAIVVVILNVSPHFVTTVGPNARVADVPEPELGWPWVFFFYGQLYSGYGPLVVPERLAYDLICGLLIVLVAGYVVSRITRALERPGTPSSL